MNLENEEIGVGATNELNLRVSVGTLVRVLFANPDDGRNMLALEHISTLRKINEKSEIIARVKPFGGGVQIIDEKKLKELIGDFHYDSERSRKEKDFRIMVRQESWEKIKEICREHLKDKEQGILDSSPVRELAEEFEDSLKIKITQQQYTLNSPSMIIQDVPSKTDNIRAQGFPTVRIYYIFEAGIASPELINLMLNNSKQYSPEVLKKTAEEERSMGRRGRANAILTLDLEEITDKFKSLPFEMRNERIKFEEYQLDGNVVAVLPDISAPEYQY
jgi:hypothetical protein